MFKRLPHVRSDSENLQPFLKGTLTTFANTYAHLSKRFSCVLLIEVACRLSATLMSRLMLNLHQRANTPAGYSFFESRFQYELADTNTSAQAQPVSGDIVLDDSTANGSERTNVV